MVFGYTAHHLFQYPVEKVVAAHRQSYNERKEVVGIKQVEFEPDVQGLEYMKWMITALNPLPKLIQKFGGMDEPRLETEEELWIDKPSRRHWLRQQNITFIDTITIQKNSTFVPDSHNPEWTSFEQAGAVDMGHLGFIGKPLELLYKNVMESDVRQQISLIESILDKEK